MPLPHFQIRLVRANTTYFVANRGGFKTTRGIAPYVIDCVYEMPQSTGIITSPSFEHLRDNTLNPLLNALNEFGFVEGEHYVVGVRPPEHWPRPLIMVVSKKYDHIISFHNGTNIIMVSMARKGSVNGISAQWGVFDEAKLMNERELIDVVFPVFRGNEKHFSRSSLFMSKFFATDKLADPSHIKWILKKRDQNDQKKIDIVISLQLHVNSLIQAYAEATIIQKALLKAQIRMIQEKLAKLRANMTFYVEASAEHTVEVLGDKWLADKKQNMKPYEYKVAILNEDPDRPEDGFYPDYDSNVHSHEIMEDYNSNAPLIIACDYQHSVAPICIAQVSKLPGAERESLNYVDEVYTLSPEGLEEAVHLFCKNYATHAKRIVYYIYDQTATGKRVNADEYYKMVTSILRRNRWQVVEVWTGKQPGHYQKYIDTKQWLKEDTTAMPIRINKKRCPKTIISITSAPAKVRNNQTIKDKSSEEKTNLDQSETTHFSDVFDMTNHAVIKLNKIRTVASVATGLVMR
mgnify:CR=1 FL=1